MEPHYRLFISDILRMKKTTHGYSLGNQVVSKVDIIGFVTFKRETNSTWIFYKVDDGTGVIDCLHSRPAETKFPEAKLSTKKGTKALLQYVKRNVSLPGEVSISSTVHIRGSIVDLRERRGVIIKTMRLITDSNEEGTRVLVMEALYRDVYDIPECFVP